MPRHIMSKPHAFLRPNATITRLVTGALVVLRPVVVLRLRSQGMDDVVAFIVRRLSAAWLGERNRRDDFDGK